MATIKVKYRPSTVDGKEGSVYFQIIHNRVPRHILTDYHIFQDEWDDKRQTAKTTADSKRKSLIQQIRDRLRWDLERLNRIINRLDSKATDYTADDVVEEFKRCSKEYSLINFMESLITKLKQNNRVGTAENYQATLNSVKKFITSQPDMINNDIMLDSLTSDVIELYESWLKNRGLCPNTTSFYMRILRAVYNQALEDGAIEDRHPFRKVYTGIDKTTKRALPLQVIKQINSLDLTLKPQLSYARDMFMLSFFLRGMSLIDMAYLRKTNLLNGFVVYRRRKTGQRLQIKWTKQMQAIVDKYAENDSDYLLPIIRNKGVNERCVYKNVGYKINAGLKKIGEMLSKPLNFTLYSARHTWASLAKAKGISISIISEALGHEKESTTQIYLSSLETSVVDNANDLIISLV